MKFLFAILMIFSFTRQVTPVQAESWARSYVVMEQASGKVLEGKDVNLRRSVASISKIMTAVVALESTHLFDVATVGDEIDRAVGSSLYLEKGSKITVMELVYGLMLRSGNDAAEVIAKTIAGNSEAFVEKMNAKASQIGMKNTVFNNPHGLDMYDDGNLSTSYDMALLMRYALNNSLFREVSSSKNYKSSLKGNWGNKHKLINNYEYATGGKTGYTVKAKRTLVTSAKKDNLELIVVTIDCGGDFAYHRHIFEKYFDKYTYLLFLLKGTNQVEGYLINVDTDIGIMLERNQVNGGVLLYEINLEENKLTMYFVCKNKERIFVGDIKVISYGIDSKRMVIV